MLHAIFTNDLPHPAYNLPEGYSYMPVTGSFSLKFKYVDKPGTDEIVADST